MPPCFGRDVLAKVSNLLVIQSHTTFEKYFVKTNSNVPLVSGLEINVFIEIMLLP